MKVILRSKGIAITEGLENHVQARAKSFGEKYFNNYENVTANGKLKVENGNHKAEITIQFSSVVLRGEASSSDMYGSIDGAFDRIEKQYIKHKDKLSKKHNLKETIKEFAPVEDELENQMEVIRRKSVLVKPMVEEEAVLQMELLNHDFFAYTDSSTNNVHIVYKRKDGKFGILETENN